MDPSTEAEFRARVAEVFEDKRKSNGSILTDATIQAILAFFHAARSQSLPMSRAAFRARVIAIVKKLQPGIGGTFKASRNFMRAFLAKHDIVQRRATTSAPKLPEGMTKDGFRELFLARVRDVIKTNLIPDYMVISADETGVFLTPAMSSTLASKGAKNVPVLFSGGCVQLSCRVAELRFT
jgi:hypothetical protein